MSFLHLPEETIKESLYLFKTNLNEAANQAVGRTCPKFKLLGTSMTLKTRVCKVASTRNMGYKKYIDAVLKALHVNQLDCQQHYFDKAIIRMDQTKIKNYRKQQTREYKQIRKHKIEAAKREQVFAARTEKKVGTYGSGLAFEKNDETENEERGTNQKRSKQEKFCNWCDKNTNHKTW